MKQQPIYVIAKWQVKEDSLQDVLTLLPELVQQTRNEEGNLIYNIHQSLSDTHTLVLFEAYKDDAALDHHRGSAHFKEIVLQQIVPLLTDRQVELAHALF